MQSLTQMGRPALNAAVLVVVLWANAMAGAGTISGRLPACAALHDHKVEAAIKKMDILCLALSMEDLMALT